MNALMLDNYDVVEMDARVMRETDGGYGYHSSQDAGAKVAGEYIWKAAGTLFDGIKTGVTNMLNNCAC